MDNGELRMFSALLKIQQDNRTRGRGEKGKDEGKALLLGGGRWAEKEERDEKGERDRR
jgi:hypothetical protein